MTTHEDLQSALRTLRAAAVKFEHNAHLGQPVRSWHVYAETISILAAHIESEAEFIPSRDGLSEVCSRVLAASKQRPLDRDALIEDIEIQTDRIAYATALAKASRR